ncbi:MULTISPECIES: hypothetical protein [Rummeliibacillus]|uniref:hypothetical protein n=1 Tax=Rummeliibacillus TaxID=648802 RepID=UPI0011B41D2A|nr:MULTISPECIES: hypothetical protein [Rummeliibacillus]
MISSKKMVSYCVSKFAAAGFLFFLFFLIVFFSSDMKMYQTVEGVSNHVLWTFIFGYSILASIFIDWLIKKYSVTQLKTKIELYAVAGFAIFLLFGLSMYTVIAGTVGIFCALIFYLGTVLSTHSRIFKYIFAIVVPITLFVLISRDYTIKKNWKALQKDNSYAASFDYFNGRQEIPIKAVKGQTMILTRQFHAENGGGHGFHIVDEEGRYVGVQSISEDRMKMNVKKAGIYRAVVTGDEVAGSFYISWDSENK